jgi:chaperone required for assembly of F1-ATPase
MLKCFWKTVDLEERGETLAITVDTRPLKTPGGKPLLLPRSKRLAATLIVTEWENQRNVLKSHALPMVCQFYSLIPERHSPHKLTYIRVDFAGSTRD